MADSPRKLLPRTAARRAAKFAADKQATEIVLLDLRKVTDFTDYFLICTGSVDVHVRAIVNNIESSLQKLGWKPLHTEGSDSGKWVLLDYVDFVIHVFQPDARKYYSLERLWGDAPVVQVKGLEE